MSSSQDHYKVLGVPKTATKSDIKTAFRKLAIQHHPDKHAHSSPSARLAATAKFKQLSEAYEVLIDDRKRAAYNISRHAANSSTYTYSDNNNGGGGGAGGYYRGRAYGRPPRPKVGGFVSGVERVFGYMRTRSFLLNLVFAGVLLGGSVAIDKSGEALWKIQNPGKSFEAAVESIEKNKASKDNQ